MRLRVQAYRQRHRGSTVAEVASSLGVSTRSVRRYLNSPEVSLELPGYHLPEIALQVWVGLDEVSTVESLVEILGVSRASVYRGLRILREQGYVSLVKARVTGVTLYRQEEPVDPFDVFAESPQVTESDPFEKVKQKTKPTDSVAVTADLFAEWVAEHYPQTPFQTNRRAMMSALSRVRKQNGVNHFQETTAMQRWFETRPRIRSAAPLWKQFLAAYPKLLEGIPDKPPETPTPQQQTIQRDDEQNQVMEMAREADRMLREDDYDEWMSRYEQGRLFSQRARRGFPLASPWDPSLTSKGDGGREGMLDQGFHGQTDECRSDTYDDLFESESDTFESDDTGSPDDGGQVRYQPSV